MIFHHYADVFSSLYRWIFHHYADGFFILAKMDFHPKCAAKVQHLFSFCKCFS